jgi:hypothetical protein
MKCEPGGHSQTWIAVAIRQAWSAIQFKPIARLLRIATRVGRIPRQRA